MYSSSSDHYNSKLIYHAGMSCNMDYCVLFGGGQSLAYVDDALDGFVNFWGMDASADKKWRIWHLRTWEQDLKDELDNGRPILYAGGNIGFSHHTWVIDGYNNDDEFHCNWGWGGSGNGYYSLGGFNPYSTNFNEFEHAIFSLYPGVDFFSEIIGPNVLNSSADEFRVNNFFDCKGTSWTYSANIAGVYGGYGWIALRATGSGTGWIQATITVDGFTYITPKKYITCNP